MSLTGIIVAKLSFSGFAEFWELTNQMDNRGHISLDFLTIAQDA